MGDDQSANGGPLESTDQQINEFCSRFERHWQSKERLEIEQCLQGCPPDLRQALLRELLLTELELRRRAGENVTEAEYCARFPQDTQVVEDVFALTAHYREPTEEQARSSRGLHIRCPHCHNAIELGSCENRTPMSPTAP